MSNWPEHLDREDELYAQFYSLEDITRLLYITKSLEGRLREDKHLIYGTLIPHNEKEAFLIRMRHLIQGPEGNHDMDYEALFGVLNLDENQILVASNSSVLDLVLEGYCQELNNKYGLKIAFKAQSQLSENLHLS